MKLLIPLPYAIDDLHHGRNLRIVHLLGRLASEWDILCAATEEHIAQGARRVLPDVKVVAAPLAPEAHDARAATLRGPWLLRRAAAFFGYDPAFHAWLDHLAGRVDAVLGFDLPCAMYLTGLGELAGRHVPTLCDVIDDPWLTYRSRDTVDQWSGTGLKTAVAVQAFRRLLLPQIDRLLAVAPRDAESIAAVAHRAVHVVPNGVTVPAALDASCEREPLVVFTGAMSFPPNEQAACWLARNVWPLVAGAMPNTTLALVGADPGPRVQSLTRLPGLCVTGRVADLGGWLRRATVAAAPMLTGTGMKNKVLEACANGCPVIATSLGAAGIPTGASNGVLIADDPLVFARQMVTLLKHPGQAERIGSAGADMVQRRFTWERSTGVLRSLIENCVQGDVLDTGARSPRPADVQADCPAGNFDKEVVVHAAS